LRTGGRGAIVSVQLRFQGPIFTKLTRTNLAWHVSLPGGLPLNQLYETALYQLRVTVFVG